MKNDRNSRLVSTIAGGLLLAGLAACSRSEPERAEVQEVREEPQAVEAAPPPVTVTEVGPADRPGSSAESNAALETPPEVEASADEQMQDDASATGMTARAERGEDEAEAFAAANREEN